MAVFTGWTPAERWLAGLLWADGHVVPRGNTIVLASCDEELIDAAAAIIGPAARRYTTQPPPAGRGPAARPLHRLGFPDPGLVPLGLGPKPGRIWPAALASGAFLRGLFDGDGSVIWHDGGRGGRLRLRSVLDSPAAVLVGARDWLAGQGLAVRDPHRHGPNGWRLAWQHYDSVRLAAIMYAEPGPRLARKRAVFRGPP